ncbi:Rpp14/Pop5 family protein [Coniella lustricola]|uniref:Ribonuclease P/MRP protein subunit POP5 n=1 Tax=Coniella lustricola TaxID=2025994 RepID=A0A2T3A0Q5_9PEZI|nr:Rpp14/Pop5 family protein [Coniella lustricola]
MVRVKERYLLVNILYPQGSRDATGSQLSELLLYNQPTTDAFTARTLVHALKAEVTNFFGDFGAGSVERTLRVKYLSNATSTCILQCSRDHYRLVWAALTMMNRVPTKRGPGNPCIFRVVRVSGTIKKVEQEAVRRARLLVIAAKDEMSGKTSDTLESLFGGTNSASEIAVVDAQDDSASEAGFGED